KGNCCPRDRRSHAACSRRYCRYRAWRWPAGSYPGCLCAYAGAARTRRGGEWIMKEQERHSESFILFQVAETFYGLPSRNVQQMEMVENITPVPNAAPFVEGVVFTRGQVIPAVNLRVRFGFEKAPHTSRS